MNTIKFMVSQYVGNKLYLITLFTLVSCNTILNKNNIIDYQKDKIKVEYLGYENNNKFFKNQVYLKFNLINLTSDTLYISKEHLNVTCKNNKKTLKNYPLVLKDFVGQILVMPQKASKEELKERKIINALLKKLSEKILDYNLKINNNVQNKLDVVKNIEENTIILFPYQSYTYSIFFYNKKFNCHTKVILEYNPTKIFTSFYNNNKITSIYWQEE